MRKYTFRLALLILLLTVLYSCGPESKGKIIKRGKCSTVVTWLGQEGARQQFLVNTSTSEKITFTIKDTYTSRLDRYDNKVYEVRTKIETELYTLNPGEEEKLSCEKYVFYNDDGKWTEHKYEIVGAVVEK